MIGASNNNSDNVGFSAHIPIPFSNSISISITNGNSSIAGLLWWNIAYQTGVSNTWLRTRRLRTSFGTLSGLTQDQVVTLVNQTGLSPGRLRGVSLSIDSYPGGASLNPALEGNVKIFLDGSSSPNYESSGTEDYFHMSNFFQGYPVPTATESTGLTLKSGVTANAYRFHLQDPVLFSNALKVTWNCGESASGSTFSGTQRLAYVVWCYTAGPSAPSATLG